MRETLSSITKKLLIIVCYLCITYVVCVYVKAININNSLNSSHLLCFIPRDYFLGNSSLYFFLGWETIVGARTIQ